MTRPLGCRNVRHGGASGLLKAVGTSGVLQPKGCTRVSGRCWVYWVERNPMGEIATTVAVGQAAIHEGRARKGRQQTFDRS